MLATHLWKTQWVWVWMLDVWEDIQSTRQLRQWIWWQLWISFKEAEHQNFQEQESEEHRHFMREIQQKDLYYDGEADDDDTKGTEEDKQQNRKRSHQRNWSAGQPQKENREESKRTRSSESRPAAPSGKSTFPEPLGRKTTPLQPTAHNNNVNKAARFDSSSTPYLISCAPAHPWTMLGWSFLVCGRIIWWGTPRGF